jgi:ATP/maltotriose-dependent transcriptional regulator MalT
VNGVIAALAASKMAGDHCDVSLRIRQQATLIGRGAELASLHEALEALGDGQPVAVEICGDPGIGKTRLLAELMAAARRRGIRVVSTLAREAERGVPFAVFADLLPNCHSQEPQDRGRYALCRQFRDLLGRNARTSGLLVAVDDAHWADAASAELLAFLLHRPPAAPVLIAVAHRPRQLRDLLAGAIASAATRGFMRRIEVGPLSREEAVELIGPAVERREIDPLYHASEGNPFYLEALLRARRQSPARLGTAVGGYGASQPASADGHGDVLIDGVSVPYPVRAAFLAELDMLPADIRLVAQAAAVAGDPVDPDLASAVACVSDEVVRTALDQLRERDVLRDSEVGRGLYFRHPLFRHAVYQSASAGWLRDAHAAAAAFLADHGAPAVARAHHVERAARRGDPVAISLLVQAATQVAAGAPATAAHWYAAAVQLTGDSAPEKRQAELRLQLGYYLGICGQFARSREEFAAVLAMLPRGAGARSMCAVLYASFERMLGRHHEAAALLRQELDVTPDSAGPAAVMLLLELATHSFLHLRHDEQHLHAERAHACAVRLGNPLLQASAAVLLALAHCGTGVLGPAQARLAEAASLIDGLSDAEAAHGTQVFIGLSLAEIYLDRYGDAIRHLSRAIAFARASGQEYTLSALLITLADAYLCTGQLARAAGCARDAVDAALLTGNDQSRMVALARQSEIALWSGDTDGAIRSAQEAAGLATPFTDWLAAAAEGTLAIVRGLADNPGGRLRNYPDSYRGIKLTSLNPTFQARAYALLTEAEIRQGQVHSAARWARGARRAATVFGVPSAIGHASFAEALVQRGSAPEAALRNAQTAHQRFSQIGDQFCAARAALLAAECHLLVGTKAEAERELIWSRDAFRDAGATRLRQRAEALLQRLRDTSAAPSDYLARLSSRELQVARLVADGRSNQEIARELAVTSKTVEAHVSHILGKLAVPSRASVAAIVTRAAHVNGSGSDTPVP